MKKYDLHIHSTFSDGYYSLEEIVDKLRYYGIEIFSITDHDNIDSIKAMSKIDTQGLTYIPGVEFSAHKDMYKMHILGYGIDGNNEELIKLCKNMKLRKNIRNLEVIKQLKDKFGIIISKEEVSELLKAEHFVGQTTIARLLVKNGIIPNVKYYFDSLFPFINPETIATTELEEVINTIHNAGGYAILAHPITIEDEYNVKIENVFNLFINAGIDGVEVFNSKHSLTDVKRFFKLAKDNDLLISGGSDYHGNIMKPHVKLGKISKDDAEKQEHYEITIISKCIGKEINMIREKNEGENR